MGATVVKVTPSSLFVAFDAQVQIPADPQIGISEDAPADDDSDEEDTMYHSSDS